MLDIKIVFDWIFKGVSDAMSSNGFEPVYPQDIKRSQTPLVQRGEDAYLIDYIGEKAKLRILYTGSKIFILSAEPEAAGEDDREFAVLSTCLFELETYTEKDIKFVINELCETIVENFGKKVLASRQGKGVVPVSRSAVKSGTSSYDSNTLANRMAANYPELKEAYKENLTAFGEFLAEDFFVNHANKVFLDIIKENNPQKVKKFFNLLNEVYEDGTGEVQSLIIVSILGSIKNDPDLIKIVLDNVRDSMIEPVIEVNRILAKSKSVNLRLENPPKYKPKKNKKGGILSGLGLG